MHESINKYLNKQIRNTVIVKHYNKYTKNKKRKVKKINKEILVQDTC